MRYDGRGAVIRCRWAACGRHSMRYDGRGALILLGHPPSRVTARAGGHAGV